MSVAVTIRVTLVDPKSDFLHYDPRELEKGQSRGESIMLCTRGRCMHLRCKFGEHKSVTCGYNIHIGTFYDDLKPSKVGQGDLFLFSDKD